MKFRIERLEERIAPGKLQCVCGGGSSHKKGGSSHKKHGSSKMKCKGGSHHGGSSKVRCSPPPPPRCS